MSQTIFIPIAVEWRQLRPAWTAVPSYIDLRETIQVESGSEFYRVHVDKHGAYYLEDPWLGVSEESAKIASKREGFSEYSPTVELLIPSADDKLSKTENPDPWAMREEFLRLKNDTPTLLKFLRKWGEWGTLRLSHDPGALEHFALSGGTSHMGLAFHYPIDIWNFQQYCRKALGRSSGEWMKGFSLPLVPRPEHPHFVWIAKGCKEAIRASITIDFLNKVKFDKCAREDCPVWFPVTSQHQRKYCCQPCGHLESVRKKRREDKAAT